MGRVILVLISGEVFFCVSDSLGRILSAECAEAPGLMAVVKSEAGWDGRCAGISDIDFLGTFATGGVLEDDSRLEALRERFCLLEGSEMPWLEKEVPGSGKTTHRSYIKQSMPSGSAKQLTFCR